jgi:hypothetical protein
MKEIENGKKIFLPTGYFSHIFLVNQSVVFSIQYFNVYKWPSICRIFAPSILSRLFTSHAYNDPRDDAFQNNDYNTSCPVQHPKLNKFSMGPFLILKVKILQKIFNNK